MTRLSAMRHIHAATAVRSTYRVCIRTNTIQSYNLHTLPHSRNCKCCTVQKSIIQQSCSITTSRINSFSSSRSTAGKLINFNLADIGEGIAECEVLKWYCNVGDTIQQFDKICEVQSDKANVEITSRYDGIIRELKYEVGQLAKVGSPLCVIELESDAGADTDTQSATTQGDNQQTNEISNNNNNNASSSSTTGSYIHVDSGNDGKRVLTSPAVRNLAKQHNIDLSTISGTGPQGRLLKEDVLNYINGNNTNTTSSTLQRAQQYPPTQQQSQISSSRTSTVPEPPQSQSSAPHLYTSNNTGYLQSDEHHAISGLQRIMVNTMNAAASVPTFGFSDEIIVDQLVKLRELVKPQAEKRGIKLSYLPFIIKATSLALKSYPQINAHVNSDCTSVTYKSAHNIGLAMDTPRGLLVPNIKNVQSLSILDIASELNRLAHLGTTGKLGKSDLTGGTFTLSNIGSLGGTYMKPILVVPEVVIGAMGTFQTLPRYDKLMQLQPTKIMYISWTGDHRVLDGATVARFSTLFKSYLETPQQMLLDTR